MLNRFISILIFLFTSCNISTNRTTAFSIEDSNVLRTMVAQREKAMIDKDINSITEQFDTSATFINGGGYYYHGLTEIKNFHNSMFNNDSLTYTYKIGNVTIHPIEDNVAIVYYPWQQQWTLRKIKSDTLNEVGLMTIVAAKTNGQWKWKSITNQRTREYFEDLETHKSKPIQ